MSDGVDRCRRECCRLEMELDEARRREEEAVVRARGAITTPPHIQALQQRRGTKREQEMEDEKRARDDRHCRELEEA